MKNACQGGGKKSGHSSKQGKLPRKYRRHQEGLVSKYDIEYTFFFGYLEYFRLPEFLEENVSEEPMDAHINFLIRHWEDNREYACEDLGFWDDELIEQDRDWGRYSDYDISSIQVKLAEKKSRAVFGQKILIGSLGE